MVRYSAVPIGRRILSILAASMMLVNFLRVVRVKLKFGGDGIFTIRWEIFLFET